MRPNSFFRSTYFRFAIALTAAFVAAYLIAGWIAFQTINVDLEQRVYQTAALQAEAFETVFEAEGSQAVIDAVVQATRSADPEDDVVWFGSVDGERLAGHRLPNPAALLDGDVFGDRLGVEEEDRFRIVTQQMGDFRLIVGRSYEESDAIKNAVFAAFGGATALTLVLAGLVAFLLARRAQRRIDQISRTLHAYSQGDLDRRISISGQDDDLDRLSGRINEALSKLQGTVNGIRLVSSDIAHDLRTPINRVGIQIEQIRGELAEQPDAQEKLDGVTAEISRIVTTFDAVLRIAQIEAGARKSRFQVLPLASIADTIHESYAAVAEEAGQSLEITCNPDDSTLVFGDRDLLIQLAANLVENSIRHAPDNAIIRLSTGVANGCPWLDVSDNGPGIPEAEKALVLTRFYRLDKSRHGNGSGLGLAIVKAIADLHDAELVLTDANPGLSVRIFFKDYRRSFRDQG